MQKDESCDACERLLPCGPARGDVQYLILCKGKHTTRREDRPVVTGPRRSAELARVGPPREARPRRSARGGRGRTEPTAPRIRPTCVRKEGIFPACFAYICATWYHITCVALADLQCSFQIEGDASLSRSEDKDSLPDDLPVTQLGHARTGRSSYAPPMCPIEATAAIATCCT